MTSKLVPVFTLKIGSSFRLRVFLVLVSGIWQYFGCVQRIMSNQCKPESATELFLQFFIQNIVLYIFPANWCL